MTRVRSGLILGGFVAAAGIAVALVGMLFVDRVDESVDTAVGDDQLAADLRQAEREAREHPVDLTTVVGGDWERVVVACPGEEGAQIDANLGFDWSGYDPQPDASTVDIYFADDTHVLRWATWSNRALCVGPHVVERDDAVLERIIVNGEHGFIVFAE